MKKIKTEILINAPIKEIWSVLMDFKNYANWNPFIKFIALNNNDLEVIVKPVNSKEMTFKPKIITNNENSEFRWKGKLLVKGLFDGEHFFILQKIDETSTKFTHGENFSGLLIPLFKKTLENTKNGFILMNNALKQKCENS